jgi:hypothetical protein
MDNEIDDLKSAWRCAKMSSTSTKLTSSQIIDEAANRKKKAVMSHYGNIVILSAVAIMLVFTWRYFFPFRETLSRLGVALMVGGLIIRIIIEFFSVTKFRKANVSDTTSKAIEDTHDFLLFRKRIHGPVTITIVALYVIGFYMLSPEFSKYVAMSSLLTFDAIFLIAGVVLTLFIRRGIKQELRDLEAVAKLQKELSSNE